MSEENTNVESSKIMTNAKWENFAKGELVNFLVSHDLGKITVDDGGGRKATVKLTKNGEYNVSYTTTELM